MIDKVVMKFMNGEQDGVCPECGNIAEVTDSDEGPGNDHWFERYYVCACGCTFTEGFRMQPVAITVH